MAIWLIFIYLPTSPDAPEAALSVEKEQEIGDLLISAYLEDVELVADSLVYESVDLIYQRLLTAIGKTDYDYSIYIIKSDNINAFATLGGSIVIYSGLLKFAGSPEEVAAVLAHEIGHVEKRHVVNKVIKELGVTFVLSILSGGDPGIIHEILQQSVSTVFDRSQETEADDYGLALLEKANIHPVAMASFFRKVRDKYSSSTFATLEFLSSHPNTNKRIKKSLNYHPQEGFVSKPFAEIDWQQVKASL